MNGSKGHGHARSGAGNEIRLGHLVANYLQITENWIHSQILAPHDVSPLVLNRGVRINESLFPVSRSCNLADLTVSGHRREADSWEFRGYSEHFRSACRGFGCQLLHAHFGTEGVLGMRLAHVLDIPLVTSFYGYDVSALPRDPAWRDALGLLFERGQLFLAEGPVLAESLARLGCPPDRIRIMPLPVQAPERLRSEIRGKSPLILVCGRLVDKKGIDDSLRAIAALRSMRVPSFECVIVGDGPERESLVALSRSLELEDRVAFKGAITPAELRTLLARAAVVLQMSRFAADGDCEGGAPVILSEALAYAVPCVATLHCDIPAIIADGVNGYLVASGDCAGAARRLAQLLVDSTMRKRMGRLGRKGALGDLSVEAAGTRLRGYYEEALAMHRADKTPGLSLTYSVPLATELALDFRILCGDVDGLQRMLRKLRGDGALHGRALRAAGDLCFRQQHYWKAARLFRRCGQACPGEPQTAFSEGKALLASTRAPFRAIAALARYVKLHPNQAYAKAIAIGHLESQDAPPALVRKWKRLVETPEERFRSEVALLRTEAGECRQPDGLRRHLREILRREFSDLLRCRRPEDSRAVRFDCDTEEAIADLLVIARNLGNRRASSRILSARPLEEFVHSLARYRIASLFESGTVSERRWAKRTFAGLARRASATNDLRAGAYYHLARIQRSEGDPAHSRQNAQRCLDINPQHRAAAALVAELRGPRSQGGTK